MNRIFLKGASSYALSQTNRAALSPSALPRGPETGLEEINSHFLEADLNEAGVPTELLNRVDINLDGGLGVLRRCSSSSMIWRRRVTESSSSATQTSSDHVDRRLRNTRKRPPQSGYTHKRIL